MVAIMRSLFFTTARLLTASQPRMYVATSYAVCLPHHQKSLKTSSTPGKLAQTATTGQTAMTTKPSSWTRYLRAPIFLPVLALSFIPVFFVFATVTTGAWCEDMLRLLGYRSEPKWLPGVFGVIVYALLSDSIKSNAACANPLLL